MPPDIGRIVLLIGVVLVVVGGLSMLGVRLPIGRLPGDIAIEGKNGGVYIPIATMLIASLILTLLWNLFIRR
jgi:Protein of unknown function (DUF2905)